MPIFPSLKQSINIFWFIVFAYGLSIIVINEFVWDDQKNPILLTHISAFIGVIFSGFFALKPILKDKFLAQMKSRLWVSITFFSASLSVAFGRFVFDFISDIEWIVMFRDSTSKYSLPEYYRFSDFLYHFFYPIGYLSIIDNNIEAIRYSFLHNYTKKKLFFSIALPSVIFIIWNLYILSYGDSFYEIYKCKNISLYYIVFGSLFVSISISIIFYNYVHNQSRDFIQKCIKFSSITFNLVGIIICTGIFNLSLIYQNTLFLSFLITLTFLCFSRKSLSLSSLFYLRATIAFNIFMFLINEIYLWSTGGIDFLKQTFFCEETFLIHEIYIFLRMISYFFNIIFLYIFLILSLPLSGAKLVEKQSAPIFVKIAISMIVLFVCLYYMEIFNRYDVLNTQKDIMYFFLSMIISVFLVFAPCCIIKESIQPR